MSTRRETRARLARRSIPLTNAGEYYQLTLGLPGSCIVREPRERRVHDPEPAAMRAVA